jgi:serine-type D-Ala-D-Ala carboxypeptidase
MEGEVHDDHAYVLGGVAGHAGLFGDADAVHSLLQTLLNAWKGNCGTTVFETPWVRKFFQRLSDTESWALGFDTPTRPDSSSGKYFSDTSVGHLGFTGTSFWMDLEKEIIVVLLTNRIHPTRANEKIMRFRPLIHDAVMESLGYCRERCGVRRETEDGRGEKFQRDPHCSS